MDNETRCRLLDLPAEIRNCIYRYALAPTGSVALISTRSKRFATKPILAPALLATCHQINKEASEILYSENTVCITVDAEDTCWPTIAESRLPQRSLEKLQHLFVILDCTAQYFNASFADVDWDPFSALISLKTLSITILYHRYNYRFSSTFSAETINELLTQLLERIPAHTVVTFKLEADSSEQLYLTGVVERLQKYLPADSIVHADAEMCGIGVDMLDLEQGCKSGTVRDVFADYHDQCKISRGTP